MSDEFTPLSTEPHKMFGAVADNPALRALEAITYGGSMIVYDSNDLDSLKTAPVSIVTLGDTSRPGGYKSPQSTKDQELISVMA